MTSHLDPPGTGVLTVDLGAIARNWCALAGLVAPSECGAVVKADAYGLGAERVIPALVEAGCRTYFVATPDEAIAARRLLPSNATLYALDGLVPGRADAILAAGAIPCLSSMEEIAEWVDATAGEAIPAPAAIHVDSGLNRLGLTEGEVHRLAATEALIERLNIALVMSHLACADDPGHPKNAAQRAAFERHRAALPRFPASLAASDGLMLGPAYRYDLVRPGYALYGGQAYRGGRAPVEPVVEVVAPVLQVRDVEVGETVGYSAQWQARRASRVAVIAAGYADGVARAASATMKSPGGHVMFRGAAAPIVGRVSMDLITVDVTEITPPVSRGDLATLIGPGLPLETVGSEAHTIGYEVLTRLGARFRRRYVGTPSEPR